MIRPTSFIQASIAALLLVSANLRAAEISWIPRMVSTDAEGFRMERVYFTDGEKKYTMAFDTETTIEEAAGHARFGFKGFETARFVLRAPEKPIPLPLTKETLPLAKKFVASCAPEGASDGKLEREEEEPLAINDWRSHRFIMSYNFYGRRFQHAVTLLTLENGQQVILETWATQKEFAEAMARSEYMISSWHVLRENEGPPKS